jgi:hypothetical protein
MIFIELTYINGKKTLINLSQAEAILSNSDVEGKNTHITGINNNGGISFKETYE